MNESFKGFLRFISFPIREDFIVETDIINEHDFNHDFKYELTYDGEYVILGRNKAGKKWGHAIQPSNIVSWCIENDIIYSIDKHIKFKFNPNVPKYQFTFFFKNKEDAVLCKLLHGED